MTVEVIRSFLQGLRGCWKHNFWRKRQSFQWGKNYGPFFSRIYEFDKPHGTVCKGPQGVLTKTMVVMRAILQDLWKWKTQLFLKKKAIFPVKKSFWPFLSFYRKKNKVQETIVEGPQDLLDNYIAIDTFFSLGPKRSIARTFSKQKINCSLGDKSFWLTFHRNTICHKTPGTVHNCPQGFLTIIVEVIRSFSQDLRGCWIHVFLKKKAIFPVGKRNLAPFFSYYGVWQTSMDGL